MDRHPKKRFRNEVERRQMSQLCTPAFPPRRISKTVHWAWIRSDELSAPSALFIATRSSPWRVGPRSNAGSLSWRRPCTKAPRPVTVRRDEHILLPDSASRSRSPPGKPSCAESAPPCESLGPGEPIASSYPCVGAPSANNSLIPIMRSRPACACWPSGGFGSCLAQRRPGPSRPAPSRS